MPLAILIALFAAGAAVAPMATNLGGTASAFALGLAAGLAGARSPATDSDTPEPSQSEQPSDSIPRRTRRRGRVSMGVTYAVMMGVLVAAGVYAARLSRHYGAARVLIPMAVIGLLMALVLIVGPRLPETRKRAAGIGLWLAYAAFGVVLMTAVAGRPDAQLGAVIVGYTISMVDFIWNPVRRELRMIWSMIRPAVMAILGEDVRP